VPQSVPVIVMHVGHVRMRVPQYFVLVRMGVGLSWRILRPCVCR
jgi:hypothetical protein